MAIKIYTRTGDKGTTSLIGGTKVPKNHIRIEAYGTIDELNSFIGLLADHIGKDPTPDTLGISPGSGTSLAPGKSSAPDKTPGSGDMTPDTLDTLREIQDRLFTIGSELATDPDKSVKMALPSLEKADVTLLENEIDRMDRQVKPLKAFLLPGGDITVSTAHIARCVCRRAERNCVNMAENGLQIDELIIQYLNRLSDYLFLVARHIAALKDIQEIEWKPRINTRPR